MKFAFLLMVGADSNMVNQQYPVIEFMQKCITTVLCSTSPFFHILFTFYSITFIDYRWGNTLFSLLIVLKK